MVWKTTIARFFRLFTEPRIKYSWNYTGWDCVIVDFSVKMNLCRFLRRIKSELCESDYNRRKQIKQLRKSTEKLREKINKKPPCAWEMFHDLAQAQCYQQKRMTSTSLQLLFLRLLFLPVSLWVERLPRKRV